jgi:hypothetical protein
MPVFTVPSAFRKYFGFRREYPMLPTSVYGNKIVVDYEDAMRTITQGGNECSEAVRRLNSQKKFQIPILKLGLEF